MHTFHRDSMNCIFKSGGHISWLIWLCQIMSTESQIVASICEDCHSGQSFSSGKLIFHAHVMFMHTYLLGIAVVSCI